LFSLDSVWFSIGWLIQAAGLALYGIYKESRRFIIAGFIIGIFCLLSFMFINVPNSNSPLFVWQYLSITLAAAVVSAAALKVKPKNHSAGLWLETFRCAAAVNLWGYIAFFLHRQWPYGAGAAFAALCSIAFGFILAFILPRIKRFYNRGFHIAAVVLGTVNTLWLLTFNAGSRSLTDDLLALKVTAFALYIIVNIIAVGWINDLLRFVTGLRKLPPAWYPLLVSGFAVLLAAQNLVVQLSLTASSLILTLLFGLTALGWVVYGFVKRNGVTRIGGLSMAFFAVAKLFVLDLQGLGTAGRIISYFAGGIVLLAISFVYQWFSRRLGISGAGKIR
jgi:hypothetical protein